MTRRHTGKVLGAIAVLSFRIASAEEYLYCKTYAELGLFQQEKDHQAHPALLCEIEKTIARYGNSFDVFDHDPVGELSGGLSQEYRQATAEWE